MVQVPELRIGSVTMVPVVGNLGTGTRAYLRRIPPPAESEVLSTGKKKRVEALEIATPSVNFVEASQSTLQPPSMIATH